MRNMKKGILFIGVTFALCLCGCTNSQDAVSHKKYDEKKILSSKELDDYYLPVTLSKNIGDKKTFRSALIDLEKKVVTFSQNINCSTEFPQSLYDTYHDCIYYVDGIDEKTKTKGQNLFVYDNNTKETTQLTEKAFIKEIVAVQKDCVLFTQYNNQEILFMSYDKKSKTMAEIKFPNEEINPKQIWSINYNADDDEVIIRLYNEKENRLSAEKWGEQEEALKTKNPEVRTYVYSYKGKKITLLFAEDMEQCSGIVANNKTVIYSKGENYGKNTIYKFDRKSNKHTAIDLNKNIWNFLYLNEKGNKLYYIDRGTIYYVDLDTKEVKEYMRFEHLIQSDTFNGTGALIKK